MADAATRQHWEDRTAAKAHKELRCSFVVQLLRHCEQVALRHGQVLLEGAKGAAAGGRLVLVPRP